MSETYNDQIIPFHDQTCRQQHGPEDSPFVFPQRLEDCQLTVRYDTVLSKANELFSACTVQAKAFEVFLCRNDRVERHVGIDSNLVDGR